MKAVTDLLQKLYHQTLAIRPKLIKLIEKYSQKKDDFTQLNEKFIKARRDYEALLESSMSHPPQHNYQQYAMRPGPPGQGYPQAGGYPPHGGPQGPPQGHPQGPPQGPPQGHGQDPSRFYGTPGPQGPHGPQGEFSFDDVWDLTNSVDHPHQVSSPPPNFPQNQGAPAPFYVAGAEVPSSHGQRPPQAQQYPPREETPHHPPPNGNPSPHQPGPINTSPPPQHYQPYSQPPGPTGGPSSPGYGQPQGRPQSTYGAQELATSVYDSPIQPHNPQSAQTWTSSVYSPDEAPNAPPPDNQPNAPPPGAYAGQPQYQTYNPSAPPDQGPPPVPTGQPPQEGMAPMPLQPGGAAYDARQGLPSQSPPSVPGGQAPQYKPYMPPGGGMDGPSAPPPSDYYRSAAY